jgi:hypothetical protein
MRFKTKIGEEFPLDVQSVVARRSLLEEITRSYVAVGLTLVATLFLIGASVLGVTTGSFEYLGAVWTVVAGPLGWIVGYYMPVRRDEG